MSLAGEILVSFIEDSKFDISGGEQEKSGR